MSPVPTEDIKVPAPPRPQPSVRMYRRIATVFVVLTLAIVGFAAYVVFSRATVVILSQPQEVKGDLIVDVAKTPVDKEVPGGVYQDEVQAQQTFPSTSVVKVQSHAEGLVRIVSTLYRSQTLVASTRIVTPDGILFRIKNRVVVPANGSVEVDAFADQAGPSGAVGDATFTIPGLNDQTRKFFQVETVQPITGGEKDVHMVTQTDLEKAQQVLTDKLQGQLKDEFRTNAKNDKVPTTGELFSFDKVTVDSDASANDQVEEFTMTVHEKGIGVFYDKDAFDKRVLAGLKDQVAFGRTLKAVNPGSEKTTLEKADPLGNRANLHVTASGMEIISPDAPAIQPEKLAGVSTKAAVQYLQAIDGVASASVEVRPFWAGQLPNVPDHIKVEVR